MLVSVSLFSIVMMIATSTIFGIIAGNRKSQNINAVVNNLNFSIESMVRDIKTGYSYECGSYDISASVQTFINSPSLCTTPSSALSPAKIAFISTLSGTPEIVEYQFIPPAGTTPGYIQYTETSNGIVSYPLTSADINITSVKMYVNNPGVVTASTIPANVVQPSVFLVIDAESTGAGTGDKQISKYHIQTFISQRHLNI